MTTLPQGGKGKSAKMVKGATGKRFRKPTTTKGGMPPAPIRRLARASGVLRIGSLSIPATNEVLLAFATKLITRSVAICESSKRKTIRFSDVKIALKQFNINYFGYTHNQ